MKQFELRYGGTSQTFTVSERHIKQVIEGKSYPGIKNVSERIKKVLDDPIDSPPLKKIVKPDHKVAVIVSDITRAWIKYPKLLPPLIQYLNDAGISDEQITIVIALGAHRVQLPEELEQIVTKGLLNRLRVIQHNAFDQTQLRFMGTTSFGTQVYLNKFITDADTVILTGGVVYHLMCGYSGGRKSVLPGIAGYSTIQQNHSHMLNPEGSEVCLNFVDCGAGKTKGNPMHEDQMEIAAFLKPAFLINVVLNPEGEYAEIFTGNYISAWERACRLVDEIYSVPIKEKADLVVASAGGSPKDINLYQASKTIDNASYAVKPGGVVVLLAECKDINEPPDFAKWFDLGGQAEIEKALRQEFTVPGYTALLEVLKAKAATYIVVTLPENAALIKKVGMIPVTSLDEAMDIAYAKCPPSPRIIIMPNAANTLPVNH